MVVSTQTDTAVTGTSGWQKAVGGLGLLVVLWVGSNLFDTATSGVMGSGGEHGPPAGASTTQPIADDDPAPDDDGGAPHDPSQFNHG